MKNLFLLVFVFISSFCLAAPNDWNQKTSLTGGKRERAVGFAIGTKGYITTGQDTGNLMLNDTWMYNSGNNTWTQEANFPGAGRRNAFAMTINGKGYIGGGIDNAVSSLGTILMDFWEYDATLNTWTQKANYANGSTGGVYFATAFGLNNLGYVFGGKKGVSIYTADLWRYDPTLDSWTQRTSLPTGVRYDASSFVVGNYGYVGLGADQNVYLQDFWKYNATTDSWSQIASFPGTARGDAVSFSIGTRGFITTGSDGGYQDDLYEFETLNNVWTPRALYLGGPRKSAVGFTLNGKGYAGTGKGANGVQKDWWEYSPALILGENDPTMNSSSISIFPNPITLHATIVISLSDNSTEKKYRITEVNGKLISENKFTGNEISFERDAAWKSGIYFVTIYSDNNKLYSKSMIFE